MKRIQRLLAGVLAASAIASAIASADVSADARDAAPVAHAGRVAAVLLHHTSIGSILTSSSGLTLYEFSRDHGADSCVKIHGCAQAWPALETSGKPTAGHGVKSSLLSSVRIAGGARQVTYAGHPLYTFSEDSRGATEYVGVSEFGGSWYAVGASGQTIK